jgi:hypothetical protein
MISFNTPNRAYLVTSHGNGWAYEITDQETGHSLWFQDDDASELQKETNDFEHEYKPRNPATSPQMGAFLLP